MQFKKYLARFSEPEYSSTFILFNQTELDYIKKSVPFIGETDLGKEQYTMNQNVVHIEYIKSSEYNELLIVKILR